LGNHAASDLGLQLTLRQPVVAIGAPVAAYMPRVSDQLNTELIIPEHADVANAMGAVAGGVVQQMRALIRPIEDEQVFRLHMPYGMRDFSSLDEAVSHAERVLPGQLVALARQAGADQVEVRMTRLDRDVPVADAWGQEIYLDTELTFTAVGRPSLA
jgi:N-methylhydantoinase A/oxoprolinase/acetone carboxylase beta subunit